MKLSLERAEKLKQTLQALKAGKFEMRGEEAVILAACFSELEAMEREMRAELTRMASKKEKELSDGDNSG